MSRSRLKRGRIAELRAFVRLRDGLVAFAKRLPATSNPWLRLGRDYVSLEVRAPTGEHRDLFIDAAPGVVSEHSFGRLWTENLKLDAGMADTLLAVCDAVASGRVREITDLRTGRMYHIYRCKSHGVNKFVRDSEYALSAYLPLKVRRVRIQSIPALA